MKRFFGSTALVGFLLLAFCFSAQAQDKTFNIKLSLHIPPRIDVGSYAASLYFKTQVEQLSAGRLKVQIFPSNQLGSERESLEGLKLGTHQMDFTSSGSVPSFFPEVQCLAIPYLFPDKAVAWKVFDGWFGKEMAEAMAKKTGMRILGIGENGIRHFVLKNKQVKTPADLKGMKIRTMENPAHIRMMKALGANPTPIAWGELYTAVQQGVVDGFELPLSLVESVKFYEVAKQVTLDGHLYDPLFLSVNEKFFQSLPVDLKSVLINASAEMITVERGIMSFYNDYQSLENIKKMGMTVYAPTAAEKEMFKTATQKPVIEYIESQIGKEWVEKLNKALREAEAELKK
ncbi:MAG: DctP family TRAP transporter solute-binding subunit [Deltaproteobacteria bacterium]|nr:MAG: DctP family TRAP transporter solute-binding subunit [Deltaproteobacteria bacterium]